MGDNQNSILSLVYQRERLPDASSYIRLLTTRTWDGNDSYTLDCELTTWHIDTSPAFYAISYSWGDPAQTALLRVNGRPISVTQNCEVALRQASLCSPSLLKRCRLRKGGKCYFWCDAVCIDQRNQAEKEAQVAAIGRIYRRAEHVLSCLGAPVEGADSPFLFRSLRCRSRQLGPIGEHLVLQGPEGEFHVDVARLTDHKWTRMVTFFLLSMPRRSVIRMCKALEYLLGTAYFQRTWICQELFLGKRVSVCCGSDCVPISAIYGLAQVSAYLSSSWSTRPIDCVWAFFQPWISKQQMRQYDFGRTRYFLWLLSAGSTPNAHTRSLGSLMYKIRHQKCGDIRDKVYGTLSMVRWPEDEAISVDYDRDTFDLAIQVMAIIRKKPGGWDGRWYDVAATVARNLALGAQPSEQLAAQIWNRHFDTSSSVDTVLRSRSPLDPAFAGEPHQHDAYWGYRLVKKGSQWAFEGGFPPFSGLAEGRTARIRKWGTHLRPQIADGVFKDSRQDDIFIPPTTQPGDWCLLHCRGRLVFRLDSQTTAIHRQLRIDRVVLIAREDYQDPSYPLNLIGKGLIYSDMTFTPLEQPDATEFKVHLADEDALVLAATSTMVKGYGDDRLETPVRNGVCVSENDAASYFNTSVCTSSYSSYALKLQRKAGGNKFI